MRLFTILFLCAMLACTTTGDQEVASSKPNIVFIIADDLSIEAVRAFGNPDVRTPHLDRLVANGTSFNHTYNMGGWNGAICAASRAMLIGGRSLWRTNAFRQNWLQGEAFDQTWPALMAAHGYDTYMTGKWHVDAPADSVFQQASHIRPGMPRDAFIETWQQMSDHHKAWKRGEIEDPATVMPVGYNRPQNEADNSWTPSDTAFGGFWAGGQHWSEVLRDDALGFIASAKEKDDPFFMYLSFNAPHDPRQAPQEYLDLYEVDKISLPQNYRSLHPYKDSIGCDPFLRDEALAPFPRSAFAVRTHLKEYYAIITHLDAQIGKILDALEASGKMDNTYIFFTADHGLAVGKHGLIGKQNMYEHSIRVPFIVVGPDVQKGHSIDADIYLQDVMPTSLELAGIAPPDYVEFNSLQPLLISEKPQSPYASIYGAYIDFQRMIRKDDFKLIVYPKAKAMELYNLKDDPMELNDLSQDPAFAERRTTLFTELLALQAEMEDELDLKQIFGVIE
ncbi:MAG: sulfatase-like hydrolase/transferase [Bacteroidota bacterium]